MKTPLTFKRIRSAVLVAAVVSMAGSGSLAMARGGGFGGGFSGFHGGGDSFHDDGFSGGSFQDGGGYVEGVYGSRNRIDLRASADFKIADGVNARISGVHKQQEGYVDMIDYGCANPGNAQGIGSNRSAGDCVVDKLGERNYSGIRASVKLEPSSSFSLVVIGDYSKEDRTNSADIVDVTQPNMAQYRCGPFCTYANFTAPAAGQLTATSVQPNTTSFEGWGVSAKATLQLSDNLNIESVKRSKTRRTVRSTSRLVIVLRDFTVNTVCEFGNKCLILTHLYSSAFHSGNGTAGKCQFCR